MSNSERIPDQLFWPDTALAEAVAVLSRSVGAIGVAPTDFGPAPPLSDWLLHERWLDSVAGALDVEVEAVAETAPQAERMLRHGSPLILRMPSGGQGRLLLVIGSRRRRVAVLTLNGHRHWVEITKICAELFPDRTAALPSGFVDAMRQAGASSERIQRAARAVANEAQVGVAYAWQVRTPVHRAFSSQLLAEGLPLWLAGYLLLQLAETLCWIASWWIIGAWALRGGDDPATLLPWAILLLCIVPLRMLSSAVSGHVARNFGVRIKQTLMIGALRISPDLLRVYGVGRLMGLVLESESLEIRAIKGALFVVQAVVELSVAVVILAYGVGGIGHPLSLLVWSGLTAVIAWRYLRTRITWAQSRLRLSEDLIEKMVGYRTRLAQQEGERLHEEEDARLAEYVEISTRLDRRAARLAILMTRGWLVIGILGLGPAVYAGRMDPGAIAVAVAGVVMATAAFAKLGMGYGQLAGGYAAWLALKDLLQAARRRWPTTAPSALPSLMGCVRNGAPVLDVRDLGFRYAASHDPILRRCDLTIGRGERILLEGESGSGKSTLAAVLAGLRSADSGLMFSRGLDQASLGLQTWRSRIAYVPQFHHNYIFNDTLAFNLLLAQEWPPTAEARKEAENMCRELGLGDLVDRMPLGLEEVVGESGWQLSHGERSRIFIARGLLQKADLLILDESTAALDPYTLQKVMSVVFARAPSAIVIAHP